MSSNHNENRQERKITLQITGDESNGELLEMKVVYPAHSKRPSYHYHPYQEEHFKVLKGKFHTKIDDVEHTYNTGEQFDVPINTPHWMYNISDEEGGLLWQVRPAMNTQAFLETMWGLEADGKFTPNGTPNLLQLAVILNEYSDEFRLSGPPFWIQRIFLFLFSKLGKLLRYQAYYPQYSLECESR